MIEQPVQFSLPAPWRDLHFQIDQLGAINFLVGPNGSGKSRFADTLRRVLPNARFLGTDRLGGMSQTEGFGLFGDNLVRGLQKDWFEPLRSGGRNWGFGIDTFIILEERPDIRILIEATLSHLFNRKIYLEWDSGNLVPKVALGTTGDIYRLDREECHGIRELLILLTHLYNDQHQWLVIDEPELNLHPQFQAFFMQEVRKIAGVPVPGTMTKGVVLVSHSPFVIDVRTIDDLRSVFSFDLKHSSPPKSLSNASAEACKRIASLIPRLNVHHKQLFFSDNPIFVEGVFDAQIIEAIQERRNVSITAAGSCVIDASGCEEVSKYLELCRLFGKQAYFLYDLDSLFNGSLRQCIRSDEHISGFLAELGLGNDFTQYCGQLDRKLTEAIGQVRNSASAGVKAVRDFLNNLAGGDGELRDKKLGRARVALLVAIARSKAEVVEATSQALVSDIEGRLRQIVAILRKVQVLLLPGGAIEHYMPSYVGDPYDLNDSAKRTAVEAEVAILASGSVDNELETRYGCLMENIRSLPAKAPVDTDAVLKNYLADYVHELQGLIFDHEDWSLEQLNDHFGKSVSGLGKLFRLVEFRRA